ncbi:VOC family protein [Streptococcus panodentis]|uniref:Glyoxalase family protein n=1 Tax=Streptococcus panodentis TaxID=1581472 RepID=A0ABS5AUL2_9STRE|nr:MULTISPECIES: VOC family protein [Streptococcus]KXT84977.1 Glyoxalase family protein [Streptococcus sp. DD11]MBP2620267.1 glyoxalase family protein [Streptococcus panodentis]
MDKVPNQIDYIEFPYPDKELFRQGRDFYRQVFGWQYQEWGPEYLDTADSGVSSGLAVDSARLQTPLIVLYTDHIEQAMTRVLEAGGEISQPLFDFPGGRRFHFKDPAGHELAFWSE